MVSVIAVKDVQTTANISRRPRRARIRTHNGRWGMLMAAPATALVIFVLGIPIVQGFSYSFTNWDGLSATWIGPRAYISELTNPVFWRVLTNNAVLLLAVPATMFISLAIAYLLNLHIWGWKVFRTLIFIPTAISWVVIGMVGVRLFADEGQINAFLSQIGLSALHLKLLGDEHGALLVIMLTFCWSMTGTNMIIFLTGMSTLDPSLNEAAKIDGAGDFTIFRLVMLPQMKRFMQFAFTISVVYAFTALFSLIFIMTGGGPGYGTTTLEFLVYQTAFANTNFGTGAMLGMILFVIMIFVGVLQLRFFRAED